MGSGNMELPGNLAMSYLDEQMNTKKHGRKGNRDFKIRQGLGGILCKEEPIKLMMLE